MTVAARGAIASRFQTQMLAAFPALALQLDPNAPFSPPDGAAWARLAFQDGDERLVGMGGSTGPTRQPLLAVIDIFVPAGTGGGEAVNIDNAARAAFRRWQSGTVRWTRFQSGPEGRGNGDAAALYRKQLIIVFTLSARG